MSVHDAKHLFPDILRSAQTPGLDKVLVAPRAGEFVVLPRVVDGKESEVVSLRLVELGLALISDRLLVLMSNTDTLISSDIFSSFVRYYFFTKY